MALFTQALFVHTSLPPVPAIRLLQILPERFFHSDGLRICILVRKFALSSLPSYHALSYCWGPPRASTPIILANDLQMPVRDNLYAFLREARSAKTLAGVWIWIDALCIDQTNIPERNDQVARMKVLYEGAAKIIIWLGSPPVPSGSASDAVLAAGSTDLAVSILQQVSDEPMRKVKRESAESARGRILAFCYERLTKTYGDHG